MTLQLCGLSVKMEYFIEIDKRSLKETQDALAGIAGGVLKAGINAANRTANTGRTRIARLLAEQMDVKKKSVDRAVHVNKARKDLPIALIRTKGKGINMIAFKAKPTPTGVHSTVGDVAHAFIATGLSENKLVFKRTGVKKIMTKGKYVGRLREQIQGVIGKSASELFKFIPGAVQEVQAELEIEMKKNLQSQIDYLLNRKKAQSE